MKNKTITSLGLMFLTANAASAMTYTTFSFVGVDTTGTNGIGGFTVTNTTTATEIIRTFTQTGDLDGLGIADDTFSFDIVATFSGTPDTISNGYEVFAGESIDFSIANVSYSRGESGLNDVIIDGFSAVDVFRLLVGEDAVVDGTTFTDSTIVDIALSSDTFTVSQTVGDNAAFRNLDFSFQIETTVPEPSSTALLGLGGLALLARRRR